MKRYLVFGGWNFDSGNGGWTDFKKSFNDLEEAKEYLKLILDNGDEWAEIVDLESEEIIETEPARWVGQ